MSGNRPGGPQALWSACSHRQEGSRSLDTRFNLNLATAHLLPPFPPHPPRRLSLAIRHLYSPGIFSEHNFMFSKNRLSQTATNFISSSSLSFWGASELYIMIHRNLSISIADNLGLTRRIARRLTSL